MADVKPVNMHKRLAMGDNVQVMKRGGHARPAKKCDGGPMKRGGKVKK